MLYFTGFEEEAGMSIYSALEVGGIYNLFHCQKLFL